MAPKVELVDISSDSSDDETLGMNSEGEEGMQSEGEDQGMESDGEEKGMEYDGQAVHCPDCITEEEEELNMTIKGM